MEDVAKQKLQRFRIKWSSSIELVADNESTPMGNDELEQFESILKKKLNVNRINDEGKIDVVLQALVETSPNNFPTLSSISEKIVSSFEFFNYKNEEFHNLCSNLIGENRNEKTLLHYAIDKSNPELVQKLLESGFKNSPYSKIRNSAFEASIVKFNESSPDTDVNKKLQQIIKDFIKCGRNLNIPDNNGKTDIVKAIDYKNVNLLAIYNYNSSDEENRLVSKLVNTISKKETFSLFHYAVKNSDVRIVKYLLDIGADLYKTTKGNPSLSPLKIANARDASDVEKQPICDYLSKRIQIQKNNRDYYKSLFELDAKIMEEILKVLVKINEMYEEGFPNFLHATWMTRKNHIDGCTDDLLPPTNQSGNCKDSEFDIVIHLQEIAKYVNLLGKHEDGIKDKFNIIPWHLLVSLPDAIITHYQKNNFTYKLFDQFSPDLSNLQIGFDDLIKLYTDGGTISFDKFEKIRKIEKNPQLKNIRTFTDEFLDVKVIETIKKEIHIFESLALISELDTCALFQCLQKIGELFKHLSAEKQRSLKNFECIKKLRDDIAHIWNKRLIVNKFLKIFIERKLTKIEQESVKDFIKFWKNLMDHFKKELFQEKSETNCNEKPYQLKVLLDKISNDYTISGASSIDWQINLIKCAINQIQRIVDDVIHRCDSNYDSIRSELKTPNIHYTCILMLTIIGKCVHEIKKSDDFLGMVNFELLHEFDFLKWVRNALMHLDNIDETGTLVDYLSNDLLTEFSICTHGQKIIEFSEYFKYVVQLIETFQQQLQNLQNEYFQNYREDEKKYLDYDIARKTKYFDKIKKEPSTLWDSTVFNFNIKDIIKHKLVIKEKCDELNIDMIGMFGKLAKFGYATDGDSSGILIKVHHGDLLKTTAHFKRYLDKLIGYRLKIVEKKQLNEYFNLKITDESLRKKHREEFVQNVNRCSMEHLENNLELLRLLSLRNAYNKIDEINEIIKSDNVTFELCYIRQRNFHSCIQVLHLLYSHIECDEDEEKNAFLNVMRSILDKGADINAPYIYGDTILHLMCNESDADAQFFDIIKQYADRLDCNRVNIVNELPLEKALESHNITLIEFLKDRTDIKAHEKPLLIAATKYGNIDFIKYLIDNHNINVNILGEDNIPIIHYAIFYRANLKQDEKRHPPNDEKYREIIKLLLVNGAKVHAYESPFETDIEHPLLWSLKHEDLELSLLLVDKSIEVRIDEDGIYPIHYAILNLEKHKDQRSDYINLIEKIVKKSKNDIDVEFKGGRETPLYLAAKIKELDVMKILIDNGADINYKTNRFPQIVKINDVEMIKFFIDNGMRGAYEDHSDYKDLFHMYSKNQKETIVQLAKEKSLNLNAFDENGKNLFWYAIEKHDNDFIESLIDVGTPLSLDHSFTIIIPTKIVSFEHPETLLKSYYEHLSDIADGNMLHILNEHRVISWHKFDDSNIMSIYNNVIKRTDIEALKLLEQYAYFNLERSIHDLRDENIVKIYLQSYCIVFERLENGEKSEKLKQNINNLKNKLITFDGRSMLDIAIQTNNFHIVKFLLNDIKFNANNSKNVFDIAMKTIDIDVRIIQIFIDHCVQISENFSVLSFLELDVEKQHVLFEYIIRNEEFRKIITDEAIANIDHPGCVKLLFELDWDPNEYLDGGFTALHKCAVRGYNDSLKVLCDSGIIDFELPIKNKIIQLTTGYETAVGYALEGNNFAGAKLLIESGASPFKYLLVLLFDALRKQDITYTNLLLDRSVIIDLEQTRVYLELWTQNTGTAFEITKNEIVKAQKCLENRKSEIENMPDYIYKQISNYNKRLHSRCLH